MDKICKVFAIAALITIAATYADVLWHQRDSMYGGKMKHTLPTTRAVVRVLDELSTK